MTEDEFITRLLLLGAESFGENTGCHTLMCRLAPYGALFVHIADKIYVDASSAVHSSTVAYIGDDFSVALGYVVSELEAQRDKTVHG